MKFGVKVNLRLHYPVSKTQKKKNLFDDFVLVSFATWVSQAVFTASTEYDFVNASHTTEFQEMKYTVKMIFLVGIAFRE